MNWTHTSLLAVCALIVAACAPAPERPPGELSTPSQQILRDARLYVVAPSESELRLLVYREGAMASFGHNHVISSVALAGRVYIGESPDRSYVSLALPVDSLDVDRPETRGEEGDDFPGTLDDDAIAGTRSNMLGEKMLDAARFQEIRLESRRIIGTLPQLTLTMDIEVLGQVYQLEVPAEVIVDEDRVTATGSFSFNQTSIGLKPFSVMLGALSVRDQVDVKFRILARAGDSI